LIGFVDYGKGDGAVGGQCGNGAVETAFGEIGPGGVSERSKLRARETVRNYHGQMVSRVKWISEW
jgi:hypothetical protein